MKIKIVQFNPVVGDITGNKNAIKNIFDSNNDCDILVFPECSVTGYPIQDMALNYEFQLQTIQANHDIIKHVKTANTKCHLIFGSISQSTTNKPWNVAYRVHKDSHQMYIKRELPIYGIFDESRTFSTNDSLNTFIINNKKVGIAICEDLWHPNVIKTLYDCDIVISLNGSPYECYKDGVRDEVISHRLAESKVEHIIYVNLVGSQDEVVFDGNSFIMNRDSKVHRFPRFLEGVYEIEDINKLNYEVEHTNTDYDYEALVYSLRDFTKKNAIKKVIIGCSGGMDSALVSSIAVDAIGSENVINFSLPTKFNTDLTKKCIQKLIELQNTEFYEIPIDDIISSYPFFDGIASENLQARIRGSILSCKSNQIPNSIVLGTSNKSELCMGYGTLYGDLIGGFNPLKDVFKSKVFQLAKWRNTINPSEYGFYGRWCPIPEEIISRKPSAELSLNQFDTDSLPDYDILDNILENVINNARGVKWIKNHIDDELHDKVAEVFQKVISTEFKRVQGVPGTKVSSTYLGKDRRFPFTNKWRG